MKPLFAIDITENKNNDVINGKEFVTKTVSADRKKNFENEREAFDETVKKSELPGWIKTVKLVCSWFFIIIFVAILRVGSIETAFQNAPGLIITACICGVAWLVLHLVGKKKAQDVLEKENASEQMGKINSDIEEIYRELEVPKNARCVDILLFRYIIKDGKIKHKALGMQTAEFFNVDTRLFVRNDELCLCDLDNLYSIKLSELRAIKKVNKRTSVTFWNKEYGPTEEKYKPYKLTVNQFGNVFFKPYYILELERGGETYGLYFPNYDLEAFEMLTGLKAEE